MTGLDVWKSNITLHCADGSSRSLIEIPPTTAISPSRIGSSVCDHALKCLCAISAQTNFLAPANVAGIHITISLSQLLTILHIEISLIRGTSIEVSSTLRSSVHRRVWSVLTNGENPSNRPVMSSRMLRNIYSKILEELERQQVMEQPVNSFLACRRSTGVYIIRLTPIPPSKRLRLHGTHDAQSP